jgi:predicted metal-dependent phosphoesterase TrpH
MTEDDGPHALHRRSLLLGGAGLGAGLVTSSPLLEFAEARPGTRVRQHFHGSFTRANTPDWHYLPFRMPRGVRALEVRYDFHPHDTGLGYSTNVVDIGVFDPSGKGLGDADGFRGWSGGARRQFRITRSWATPGYLAGRLTPGRWHVILGPFLIVPPGTPWKVTVTMEHGDPTEPAFEADHAPTSVPGTGPGWYRGDLHLHSVFSDGHWRPRELVEQARQNGLDFLGTSEHNTNAATRIFGRVVPDDFLVVSGEEVTTRNGHWLATGTKPGTWVDWRYRAEDHKLGRFANLTRDRGGIAVAAHPFVPVSGTRWDFGATYAHMDAVEVWNGPWSFFNQLTLAHWQSLLAGGHYVPGIGNSDSHHSGQTVGLSQTSYRLPTLSTAAVMEAARGGHCWIAESSDVQLEFTGTNTGATASSGGPGDRVAVDDGARLAVHLSVSGVPGTLAQVVGRSGAVLGAAYAENDGTLTLDVDVDRSEAFARAEVRRASGTVDPTVYQSSLPMVALTNPVFVV